MNEPPETPETPVSLWWSSLGVDLSQVASVDRSVQALGHPVRMALPVLQPVRRRRRRRVFRLDRALFWLLVLVLCAGATWRLTTSGGTPAPPHPKAMAVHRPPARPLRLLHGPPLLAAEAPGPFSARAAILIDADDGRVLWTKRPHLRLPIASTTKIMTALLALQHLPPDSTVRIGPTVPRVPLVREGLRAGERVPAWKLLYGLLLYSGNDDALALAIATSGSRGAFIQLMNREAARLGLRDSHFTSPSGVIDDGNYSSAWDLAALGRYAMREPRFRAIVRTRREEVSWAAPTNAKIYLNKNRLLKLYPGAIGIKTGWTTLAGPCLVAAAQRHGTMLIAVVLDSQHEYHDAARLLNVGFRLLG
jgi:D-alanyl-D-alanine carboxypeptidase (penicillin-binding protein 5/6)